MRSEIILVTPKQADTWLKNQGKNRKPSPTHVRYLANEIKSGRWRLTHQGIAFGDDGRLLDGQHRLAAIIESGIATNMMVSYEVPIGEFAILDRGMPRNISVITGIPKFGAECYQFMITMAMRHSGKPSPDDVYLLHKNLSDITEKLQEYCNTSTRFFSSVPIRTAAIVSIASGEVINYVHNTYRDLVLQNLRNLPDVAQALVRAYNRSLISQPRMGKYPGEPTRIETYAKARYLFTKSNSGSEKIQISQETFKRYLAEVTELVKKALLLSPNQEKSILLEQIAERDKQIRDIRSKLMRKTAMDIEAEQIKLSKEAVA